MKMKRLTAMVSSAAMVFSLLAGLTVGTKAEAAVTSEFPTTNGLYVTSWIDFDWNGDLQKAEVTETPCWSTGMATRIIITLNRTECPIFTRKG